jgi:hypothetical protein
MRQKEKMMRKIFAVIAIILMASGYAAGADYWHFGMGMRLTGVMPGKVYSNALGEGILLTFGNPDSRFATQFDFDNWGVSYQKTGDLIRTNPITDTSATYKKREHQYSGLGIGVFERYRAIDFTERLSAYLIGGFGGYFLTSRQEESDAIGKVAMQSKGQHSLGQLSGGLGFEGKFNDHLVGFIEGRFVGILNASDSDKNLMNGYLGVRYIFSER